MLASGLPVRRTMADTAPSLLSSAMLLSGPDALLFAKDCHLIGGLSSIGWVGADRSYPSEHLGKWVSNGIVVGERLAWCIIHASRTSRQTGTIHARHWVCGTSGLLIISKYSWVPSLSSYRRLEEWASSPRRAAVRNASIRNDLLQSPRWHCYLTSQLRWLACQIMFTSLFMPSIVVRYTFQESDNDASKCQIIK